MVYPMRKLPVILFLGVALLICLYPFAWMFFSIFKTNREIYQPTLFFPADYNWDGFLSLFSGSYILFMDYFLNERLNINQPSDFMDFYEPVLLEIN